MNRRLFPMLLALALVVVAGCGPGDSGSLGPLPTDRPATTSPAPAPSPTPALPPAPTPTPTPTPEPAPPATGPGATSPAPQAQAVTIQVWFTRDGRLFPTSRIRPATPATSRLALTELIAGPSAAEAAAGVGSGVPVGLTFDVSISAGVATVDFPDSFYSGGMDAARLRQGQVVYSLTQFPTVSRVGFQSDGAPAGAPVGRADYADLLPSIVVTSPVIGQRVTSPVPVTGTANVFEATVSVRILDASGAEIATTFTTATCGSGCRGDYAVSVPFRVTAVQPGWVQVFEVSAADGSRINVVDLPITLAP